ncbi:hypothetical protein [Sphingobium yanoikuyae]|uniref:hypothetical protein n=1 Tax=Sphingobium yanoikuyae TaxID=13690 RepID=UPI000846A5BD|nr:hypothetical protein [Sphingobium yanoikuyae]
MSKVCSHQSTLIYALERALADARSGRLHGFASAGIGQGEHVLAYSFNDEDAFTHVRMAEATKALLIDIMRPSK